MNNATASSGAARVLVVGRSPSVLVTAAGMMRARGHLAEATNQYDQVLDDYDVSQLDILVFGGMVPPDTKEYLREEIGRRNSGITFIQGLAGIPGVIAAQVDAATRGASPAGAEIGFDAGSRTIRVTLPAAARVTVEALWMTSWRPPEPASTSREVFGGECGAGVHDIAIPDQVPAEASFAAVTAGSQVAVFAIGPMPAAVTRMAPKSAADTRLPGVASVATHSDGS